MTKKLSFLILTFLIVCFTTSVIAQTSGVLTFTFMPVTKSPCYFGSQNVLAVWIQTNAGAFVKTKIRNCCGGSTFDHLPTYAVNSGGTAFNASAGNITDGTSGATLSSFTAKSFTWDAKDVNGVSNGTVVADGIYKVTIQATWNHGTGFTATTSYTFTKGPSTDNQIITNDPNFGNILIDWVPSTVGIDENKKDNIAFNFLPNPTNGVVFVDYKNVKNIKVINTLGVIVYDETIESSNTANAKRIDLTAFANGIYIINVSNDSSSSNYKVLLNK